MDWRASNLADALRGLRQTGVPLVGLDAEGHYYQAGFGDDAGLYYAVPGVADGLGVSLRTAAFLVFGALWLAAVAWGLGGTPAASPAIGIVCCFSPWPDCSRCRSP